MRANSREEILDAALRVVDAVGGADITYASVAAEAGLTKAGLMYHFPTRDSMMVGVIEHVIERWQSELAETLDSTLEESTLKERVGAFIAFAGQGGVTAGEFVVFAEAVRREELAAPWLAYLRRWFDFDVSDKTTPLMLVWLAANGMWISEATGILALSSSQRGDLLSGMLKIIEDAQ